MKKAAGDKKALQLGQADLDELIEDITTDAYGGAEQLWAFRKAFEDNIALPTEGFVIGTPVRVLAFDFDGNERRGLTARCRGADGRTHNASAADLSMAPGSGGARYVAAYRKWMGLTAYPPVSTSTPGKSRDAGESGGLDATGPVEVVVLSLKHKAARCRVVRGGGEITLRATRLWDLVLAQSRWSSRAIVGLTPAIRIYPARSNRSASKSTRWIWSR